MARKSKKKALNPTVIIVILLIIVLVYAVSLYIDKANTPSEETSTNDTSGITVSSGELGEVEYHFIDVGQGDATLTEHLTVIFSLMPERTAQRKILGITLIYAVLMFFIMRSSRIPTPITSAALIWCWRNTRY